MADLMLNLIQNVLKTKYEDWKDSMNHAETQLLTIMEIYG